MSVAVIAGLLLATGAAAAEPPIAPSQYAAIVEVRKRAVTLDARRPVPARVRAADRACRALPRTSALVAAFRATCRGDVDAVLRLGDITGCKQVRPCVTAIRRYASAVRRQAAAGRAMNQTLRRSVSDVPCRDALRYRQGELLVYDRLGRAADALEVAVRSESSAQFARAFDRFFGVDRRALRPHRQRLHELRVACR
ncbi:hypothetical protein DSM112329_03008 [Paraconexibacter sp. AEG42_29]|uniref:HTH araC/xylS-type domain-containing protein n=1 Tax=Paraconexibacter sp. AEG42_29 TaxID=2997339 RepID=A0AAU7AWY7_9ACTN